MRLLRLMPAALAIFLSACSNEYLILDPDGDLPSGEVVFNLSAKVSAQTKSAVSQEENTINTDDFWIEVFNSRGIRLVSRPYSELKNKKTGLNVGQYRFLARHGDSLGAGFNKAFYMADTLFDVRPQTLESVKATARLANVKVAVKFGESIAKYYSDEYYAIVRHGAIKKKSIRFEKEETRAGYIPAGELILEVYANVDGQWKYFACEPKIYEPQDFVIFNVETGTRNGGLDVNILIDDELETVEETVEIPAMDLATVPPKISVSNFDSDNTYSLPESTAPAKDNIAMSFVAEAGIESAMLVVEKDNTGYFSDLGITSIDLARIDDAGKAALKEAGLFFVRSEVAGIIDFAGALKGMNAKPGERVMGGIDTEISLTVTDRRGHSTETKTVAFKNPETSVSFDFPDYAMWGWKVDGARVATSGDASLLSLQCSCDGINWSSPVRPVSVSGNKATFGEIAGLSPNTEYKFRAIYDNNYPVTSTIGSATTEYPQQVGNAGFEEYKEQEFSTKKTVGKAEKIKWWQIYSDANDAWWAVNSLRTLNAECSPAYINYKSYPTVSVISNGAYSGKSIVIASISYGDGCSEWAFGTAYKGELFIGRDNGQSEEGWAKTSEGHAFGSRPAKLSFMYKFDPHDGYPFGVSVSILASDGSVIGEGSASDSNSVSKWTRYEVPIVYSVTDKKAAKICMSFISDFDENMNPHGTLGNTANSRQYSMNTLSGNTNVHAAGVLYLDNIELLYE